MTAPALTVVAPVYNEAAILPELARRCADAAAATGLAAEVLLVDDASTDDTARLTPTLDPRVQVIRLPTNRGQLGATFAGLRLARGDVVVVLDGDLQDPPEHLGALVARLRADPTLDVVFASKAARDDPWWFRAGRAGYAALLALPGARAVPPGCGAYCAMTAATARRVSRLRVPDGNLAPLLVALGARTDTARYVKVARYDGRSRVGPLGLVAEALPSLALTGALSALAGWSAAALLVAGLWRGGAGGVALGSAAAALAAVAALTARWARSVLGDQEPGGPP